MACMIAFQPHSSPGQTIVKRRILATTRDMSSMFIVLTNKQKLAKNANECSKQSFPPPLVLTTSSLLFSAMQKIKTNE